ncbi:hypothetical protein Nepgr_026128 [Nepenthes gracilis]|uniref:Vesicle-fusing ATPase n=1 Tax=Nepenthes gracilis TaxID=150966 RepID=A0AAD3Y1R8_NEPGR|nr:hypothetical protein Nepgr_026128 [Nepenthes gracilis]
MGFGSNESTTMLVTNTPDRDLVYTNFAYCSSADLRLFAVPGWKNFYASFGDLAVLSLAAHEGTARGQIGLNAIQRRHLRVSTGDAVSLSKFIPPEDFNLALLSVELEFVRKGNREENVDAVALAQLIRNKYIEQESVASLNNLGSF